MIFRQPGGRRDDQESRDQVQSDPASKGLIGMDQLLYRPKQAAQVLGISVPACTTSCMPGRSVRSRTAACDLLPSTLCATTSASSRTRPRGRLMSRPRRLNGDGSLTQRADGRWMGRYYAWTAQAPASVSLSTARPGRKPHKMREAQERNRQGIPVPDRIVEARPVPGLLAGQHHQAHPAPGYLRPVRDDRPALSQAGSRPYRLRRLSVAHVQQFLNSKLAEGHSSRNVHLMRPAPRRRPAGHPGRIDRPQRRPSRGAARMGTRPCAALVS